MARRSIAESVQRGTEFGQQQEEYRANAPLRKAERQLKLDQTALAEAGIPDQKQQQMFARKQLQDQMQDYDEQRSAGRMYGALMWGGNQAAGEFYMASPLRQKYGLPDADALMIMEGKDGKRYVVATQGGKPVMQKNGQTVHWGLDEMARMSGAQGKLTTLSPGAVAIDPSGRQVAENPNQPASAANRDLAKQRLTLQEESNRNQNLNRALDDAVAAKDLVPNTAEANQYRTELGSLSAQILRDKYQNKLNMEREAVKDASDMLLQREQIASTTDIAGGVSAPGLKNAANYLLPKSMEFQTEPNIEQGVKDLRTRFGTPNPRINNNEAMRKALKASGYDDASAAEAIRQYNGSAAPMASPPTHTETIGGKRVTYYLPKSEAEIANVPEGQVFLVPGTAVQGKTRGKLAVKKHKIGQAQKFARGGYVSPKKEIKTPDNAQPPRIKRMVDDIVERGKPELQSPGDKTVPTESQKNMNEHGRYPTAVPYPLKRKTKYRLAKGGLVKGTPEWYRAQGKRPQVGDKGPAPKPVEGNYQNTPTMKKSSAAASADRFGINDLTATHRREKEAEDKSGI